MNNPVNELANAVFKKPLQECGLDELHQATRQYPYFGPAQLLLAKKLSLLSNDHEDRSSLYEEQVQKASLYFQNRVWLHLLLNGSIASNPAPDHSLVTEKEEEPIKETELYHPPEPITNEQVETEMIAKPAEEERTEQPVMATEETIVQIEATNTPPANENTEMLVVAETDIVVTEQVEIPLEMPSLRIEPLNTETRVIFEPYHTVDYFASQGIKFKEEDKPKDRFGEQLKSFTEWLKTLKKAPAAEIIANANESAGDAKVDQMAEYSIAERHVITEAMAEVWKKQGNKARAEDIYRKLSLLDPSKSSYFAAKIEELKKTS